MLEVFWQIPTLGVFSSFDALSLMVGLDRDVVGMEVLFFSNDHIFSVLWLLSTGFSEDSCQVSILMQVVNPSGLLLFPLPSFLNSENHLYLS